MQLPLESIFTVYMSEEAKQVLELRVRQVLDVNYLP